MHPGTAAFFGLVSTFWQLSDTLFELDYMALENQQSRVVGEAVPVVNFNFGLRYLILE